MKVYLSGIVHGSQTDGAMYDQEYRDRITAVLTKKYRSVTVYSPLDKNSSLDLSDTEAAEKVFFNQIEHALSSDLVIAYLPAASMGSAIEIWEAYKNSKPVIIISPLEQNWTVCYLSTKVCVDLNAFEAYVNSGEMDQFVLDRYERR